MALGAAALIIILSVFNGFDRIIRNNLSQTDPDYLILPSKGKTISPDDPRLLETGALDGVDELRGILEETAALRYDSRQSIARIQGREDVWQCCVSSPVATELGLRVSFLSELEMYYPSKTEEFSLLHPESALEMVSMHPGVVLDRDEPLVIIPMEKARELFHTDSEVSACELWAHGKQKPSLKQLQSVLGEDYRVLDRYMQHPAMYKMMKYEKAAIFLILVFMVIIIAFNIYSSLRMLIIEKSSDMQTLRSMGATRGQTARIFVLEGMMVTMSGVVIGLAAGIAAVLIQDRFGLVAMPGNYLSSAYPVVLKAGDVVLTIAGVGLVGAAVSLISIKNITK